MKIKLMAAMLAIMLLVYGMVNVIIKKSSINKYNSKEMKICVSCKKEKVYLYEININDLRNLEVELNKSLFQSYSNTYEPFDGRCYEDTCMQLIKTKIPNISKEYFNLYNFHRASGAIKDIDYDESDIVKEINFI